MVHRHHFLHPSFEDFESIEQNHYKYLKIIFLILYWKPNFYIL